MFLGVSNSQYHVNIHRVLITSKGPFVGKLFDNYGPRYLLLAGTVLHVFGLMMASVSKEYYQFILSQGVCSPIGASMLFFPGKPKLVEVTMRC